MAATLTEHNLEPRQMMANLAPFAERVERLAERLGLDMTDLTIDHIALRINCPLLASEAHQAWLAWGDPISTAEINGRPIVVIKFTQPLTFKAWSIACLELPYPKAGKMYPQQGWEHIECVIPSEAQDIESFKQEVFAQCPRLAQRWSQLASLGIDYKESSPKGEGERLANPTLAFKADGVCIKLHPHRLSDIIASE
ncbi:VOC family protein [Vibrio sp. HB161653]|uniref:VOC family protein n=1 Tax=Vibrio sp. HB161653 TaxID=3068274 RepID=UPI0035307AE5